jgi:hypothetical protein
MTVNPDGAYRHPWDSLVNMGGSGELRTETFQEGTPDRPWISPGPPPGGHYRKPRASRRGPLIVVAVVLALVTVGVASHTVRVMMGQDSGVGACQAISEGRQATGEPATSGAAMTQEEYRRTREVFADSRVPGIRDNGTMLMDLAWQVQSMGDDGGALLLAGRMAQAYSELAGACAEQGYAIPPLGT